jgi:pimeloyl-ACP methyl ester carboxylesterase
MRWSTGDSLTGRPDVAFLADHLRIDSFDVAGVCFGGMHALACAALIPGRVKSCGVFGGYAPFVPSIEIGDIAKSSIENSNSSSSNATAISNENMEADVQKETESSIENQDARQEDQESDEEDDTQVQDEALQHPLRGMNAAGRRLYAMARRIPLLLELVAQVTRYAVNKDATILVRKTMSTLSPEELQRVTAIPPHTNMLDEFLAWYNTTNQQVFLEITDHGITVFISKPFYNFIYLVVIHEK